jgi:hypothetical protein
MNPPPKLATILSTNPQEVSGLLDHGLVEGIPLIKYTREPKLSVIAGLTPLISPARFSVMFVRIAGTGLVMLIGPGSNLKTLTPGLPLIVKKPPSRVILGKGGTLSGA